LEAIRNYYNEYYVPNNMAIIMSGDFDPDAVAAEVANKVQQELVVLVDQELLYWPTQIPIQH
jgi:predicted Zn-dependent peptidase